MIGKIIAALIGRSIDRRDGRGGMKGMIAGVVAASFLRRLGPLGWAIGAIWVVFSMIGGKRHTRRY